MLNLIPDALKLPAAGIVGAILCFAVFTTINTVWWLPAARNEGRDRYIAERAVNDQKAELERKGDDAKLQRMSDYDLCIASLGRVPECDGLKLQPVREEQSVGCGNGGADPSR
jgi:hypothetical protein